MSKLSWSGLVETSQAGQQKGRGSIPHWLSFHLKSCVFHVHCPIVSPPSPPLAIYGTFSHPCQSECKTILVMTLTVQRQIVSLSPPPSVPAVSSSRAGDVMVYFTDINQPSLATSFYSVLVSGSVFMALLTLFHSINSPDNSSLSHSVLLVLILPYWSFQPCVSVYKSPSALL